MAWSVFFCIGNDAAKEPVRRMKANYTYIVECSDGTFYTGWTNDIQKRIGVHNAKKGAKYTRSRTPVRLVYLERAKTRRQAMQREAQIKQMSRQKKERLIKERKDIYGNDQI